MPSKASAIKTPPGWGDDPLSELMTHAMKNSLATFVQKPAEFSLLARVHMCFAKIGENMSNPRDVIGVLMMHRSHGAFLAAARLATSGQVAEATACLRTTLEYALYALHINKNPGYGEIWMRRHDDADSLKAVRSKFSNGAVLRTLEAESPSLHKALSALYEQTIDFGAHPNERGVTGSMTYVESEGRTDFASVLLHGDDVSIAASLKLTAQVGVAALSVFEKIFSERFRILGIDMELDKLRQAL